MKWLVLHISVVIVTKRKISSKIKYCNKIQLDFSWLCDYYIINDILLLIFIIYQQKSAIIYLIRQCFN